jgi:predicted esterase
MNEQQKQVTYTSSNTYLTLNSLAGNTRNVWMVFHGMGYLSRYFISHFRELDPDENYIIAPQAPSKYYLNNQYKHIGASWLTRENTPIEIENVLNYVNAVFDAEKVPANCRLIVLGFSQGVSVAMRWVARQRIPVYRLLLYAGGIPTELQAEDFDFLGKESRVRMVYGDKDEYLNAVRVKQEKEKANSLFGRQIEFRTFRGGHEINNELLKELAK